MCYPKPGPRCSAHAAATFAKAHQAVLSAFYGGAEKTVLDKLITVREKAKKEFDITPAGLLEQERTVDETGGSGWAQEILDSNRKLRAKRLSAVKEQTQRMHPVKSAAPEYQKAVFNVNGDAVRYMPIDHENVTTSMQDSARWSGELSDAELESVAWYSKHGYGVVNGYLARTFRAGDWDAKHYVNSKRIEHEVMLLDSALEKHAPHPDGVMVYRRHNFFTSDGGLDHTPGLLERSFTPGSVYAPGFYLSTSLNPDFMPSEGFSVAMQIKTKTGVPLTSVSSQGPREYEFLIPRDAKFKVLSNDVRMVREGRSGQEFVRVVQLEEL